MHAYFDSSAIFKLAHEERETLALIEYLETPGLQVSTSVVGEVEVLRTVRQRGLDAADAMTGFFVIGLDNDVCQLAAEIGDASLKTLDAIHVATALAVGDRNLQFVTYDQRQADRARQAGLNVIQPGR